MFGQLIATLKKSPKTIVFTEGTDPRILEASARLLSTDTFVPTENLEEYQPVISFIPGWKQDISACRRWEELPDAAKNYIKTLEKLLDHEIQFISVGAKREEYLIKGEWL